MSWIEIANTYCGGIVRSVAKLYGRLKGKTKNKIDRVYSLPTGT